MRRFFRETILRKMSVHDTTIVICGKNDGHSAVCKMQRDVQETIL